LAPQGDKKSGRVSRTDVAAVCVAALTGKLPLCCLRAAAAGALLYKVAASSAVFHGGRFPPAALPHARLYVNASIRGLFYVAFSFNYSADPAAKNVTLELTSKPATEGQAPPPLAQQLKGLFGGLKPDSSTPSA
jgi:hypothetical protein